MTKIKHIHIGEITFDKKIRCRVCNEYIDSYTDVISVELSGTRALRIIKEIAEAGEYVVSVGSPDFPLYTKVQDGIVTEITVRKVDSRIYETIKYVHYDNSKNMIYNNGKKGGG